MELTSSARARTNELKKLGLYRGLPRQKTQREIDNEILRHARDYWRRRGVPIISLEPYRTADEIARALEISRIHQQIHWNTPPVRQTFSNKFNWT